MTNAIKYRKLYGLKSSEPAWADIETDSALSVALDLCQSNRLFLCGSLAAMSREYVEEPLRHGYEFARQYVHKFRSPVYRRAKIERCDHPGPRERIDICKSCDESNDERERKTISVKLVSESWLPECQSLVDALPAWKALKDEWTRATKLPLLSTPAATGKAFLWESLPKGIEFPKLSEDLARHIRRISPQHRLETFRADFDLAQSYQYDGRFMYAALCSVDRFPVGEPIKAREFQPYQPGWYRIRATVPREWAHIGLLPVADDDGGSWLYPREPGERFETWASEPELTIALGAGWSIEVIEGWKFEKGKPLANWARKLIAMRDALTPRSVTGMSGEQIRYGNEYARAAIRNILNHAIGSLHVNGFERETFIPESDWRQWLEANRDLLARRDWERVEGGRMVPVIVPDQSPLSIYMPHWSATVWALERARVAQYALRCDPSALVHINGDAIYADRELPIEDNGNLGQLRRKAAK